MLRFTDIIHGRHSIFEPKLSHFVITLIVFVAVYYLTMQYRYLLPWYVALLFLAGAMVSAIGLVISFSSLRHPKMILIQALAFTYLATRFHAELEMKATSAVVTFVVVYFIIRNLCSRYLKLRNIWETTSGILAVFVIYPYVMMLYFMLLY